MYSGNGFYSYHFWMSSMQLFQHCSFYLLKYPLLNQSKYVLFYICTLAHVFMYMCMYVIEGTMPLSAKDAVRKFYVELIEYLPLENPIFFAMAKVANLFPLGTADIIAAKPTRADKAAYFLQYIIEPGADDYLPKLLKVMKRSEVYYLEHLADKIHAALEQGTYTH